MQLTVDSIINYEILEKARVLTAKDFVTDRTVQWISVMEMPVENFVRQNEVVLTTAIGCHDDIEKFEGFVQDIIDSNASALMIAIGRHVFDIPTEVIELAEQQNFVIIELPWEVRFSAIIEEVMRNINDTQYKDREKSEKVQQELLKLILGDTDLEHISKYIQRQIDCQLLITDRNGFIQAKSGYTQDFMEKWKNAVIQGDFPIRRQADLVNNDPMLRKFQASALGDRMILQIPVLQVSEDPQGYIFVVLPKEISVVSYLTHYRVAVLEHAATTISLWLSRENAIEETKMSLRSDFVQEVATGGFISAEKAFSRAKLLGYNLDLPYICLVGFPENFKEMFEKRKQDYHSYTQWTESMIRYIEEEIYFAAQSLKREIMITYQGNQLLIYLEKPADTVYDNAINFLDLIDRRLKTLLPEVNISWGIGDYSEGFQGLPESYQHANIALDIGRRKKGKGQRMLYSDTRIDRVLLTLAQNEEMKGIIMATIQPLVEYDKQRNMDLIGTLKSYNQNHGNVSQAARDLSLHRQSLLYRLRKIESLTGHSLIDPDDLFLLDLSIKTWEIGVAENIN
ncbi:PucR family transcriptional regulator [Planococcus antarcticus DSM 14505]|uniref:PucR family transcriptional regulator n=1 Tax=Planococcus antarcticus DSM 14505 TaxID=1185653 RepID=A0ABM6D955_9BACL|nr:PucR family transcriptional regulator [Planococcus antarcticus]ANU11782.1 PucR family transcriptional regulator [Planococcus antarcticus DSM 14505]